MKVTNEYLIPFVGLKLGKHSFDFRIDKTFFAQYDYDDFESCNIHVDIKFEKKSTLLELNFKHKGNIFVPCDLTNEMFELPIKGKLRLIVQFGDAFNNDNEELLILPHGEYQIDVSQYIYEMIVLSIPTKRVHPGVKDGTLDSEALKKLEMMSVKKIKEQPKEADIDPRWEQLKKLLTDK